jgi:hypothetical protein
MVNKRTIIGVVSAGALLMGVGIARNVVTTERIVTDEAFNLAQQTGQPVWETYQRNVWLAWVGSVIAVAGVSGVAASLYARDEEIEDIADRASGLRDRLATTVPALRAISAERRRALPLPSSDPLESDPLESAVAESADELTEISDEAATNRLKKFPTAAPITAPIKAPIAAPITLQPNTTPPLHLTRTSDPLHDRPNDRPNDHLQPLSSPDNPSPREDLEACAETDPTSDGEWLDPLDLRDHATPRSKNTAEQIADPIHSFSDDAKELEPLFLSEPSLDDWGVSQTQVMSLPDESSEDLVQERDEAEPAEERDDHDEPQDYPDDDNDGANYLETSIEADFPISASASRDLGSAAHDARSSEHPASELGATPLKTVSLAAHSTDPTPTSATVLTPLVAAPLLCVCGDDSQETIVIAKANLLRELIDQRLDRGHKCIVCDPYDEAQTWRGCDRLGQNEDYATIDVAIATIVAELETRLEALKTGQADFSPITLVCFCASDWIDRCASAPLLAARAIDAARVAIALLLVEIAPPKRWSAFGHNALNFPNDAFIELELDTSDVEFADAEPEANIIGLDASIGAAPLGQNQISSTQKADNPIRSPIAVAWLRDPTRPETDTFETIALPEFNTPLFSAPPIRSRPPLTVPPIRPAAEIKENLVGDLSPNQAENSYSMADSETEKQLRSQIALFQNLGMTREQIVVAVWDVRNPDSDEYEIASAFYDRLTH